MSTLSSASTPAQVQAAYADNASYMEDGSPTKARTFITACRMLLLQLPARAEHGRGGRIEMNVTLLREQIDEARRWLATSPAAGAVDVLHPDMTNIRDLPPGMGFPNPFVF